MVPFLIAGHICRIFHFTCTLVLYLLYSYEPLHAMTRQLPEQLKILNTKTMYVLWVRDDMCDTTQVIYTTHYFFQAETLRLKNGSTNGPWLSLSYLSVTRIIINYIRDISFFFTICVHSIRRRILNLTKLKETTKSLIAI